MDVASLGATANEVQRGSGRSSARPHNSTHQGRRDSMSRSCYHNVINQMECQALMHEMQHVCSSAAAILRRSLLAGGVEFVSVYRYAKTLVDAIGLVKFLQAHLGLLAPTQKPVSRKGVRVTRWTSCNRLPWRTAKVDPVGWVAICTQPCARINEWPRQGCDRRQRRGKPQGICKSPRIRFPSDLPRLECAPLGPERCATCGFVP